MKIDGEKMKYEDIPQAVSKMGLKCETIVKGICAVVDPQGKIPKITICVEPSLRAGEMMFKFIVFVCDVPIDTKSDFFKDFMKLNFRVQHGAFAMESKTELIFMDTLEAKNLDENEFTATLEAMIEAPKRFREKYDLDFYTLGTPQC